MAHLSSVKASNITIIVSATLAIFGMFLFFLSIQPHQHGGHLQDQTDIMPQDGKPINNCTKEIQAYDPGPTGGFMCPIMFFQTYTKVDSDSGFDEVCFDKRYRAGNYVFESGYNGSITYTIYPNLPLTYAIQLPHLNMVNHAYFKSTKGGGQFTYADTLKGVSVVFEPKSEVIWPWNSPLVTANIYSTRGAETGSHWLFLPPGVCGGGSSIIITILNTSRTS